MRKWIYDNPWVWVALFLAVVVAGSLVVVAIAELNKPEVLSCAPANLTGPISAVLALKV